MGKKCLIHVIVPAMIISMFMFGINLVNAAGIISLNIWLYLLIIFCISTLVIHLYYNQKEIVTSIVIGLMFTMMWFAIQMIILLIIIVIIIVALYIRSMFMGVE